METKPTLYCSFCGKSQHDVRKLVAGPAVFICDECVDLCVDIINENLRVDGTAEYMSWFGIHMAKLDIDWSDCPLVQRHPDYISGALAMRSSPRMPVETLIVNHNHGYSVEEMVAIYAPLDAGDVREIIRYAIERS